MIRLITKGAAVSHMKSSPSRRHHSLRARGKKLIEETPTLLNLESSPFNSFPNFPTLSHFYEYPQISLVRNRSDSSTEEITTTSERREVMKFYNLFLLFIFELIQCLSSSESHNELPRGHGEELGRHRDSDGHVDIIDAEDLPSPKQFWDQYASIRKPVIFRGAGKHFPAFHLWTDEYLKENYGELEVKLESKREKDEVPVGERGLGRDTIRSFLETYQEKDSYTVSQLPDPLSTEVMVLPFLMCGSFSERILEANLWLSSGGTRSMLHKDADNAFNCLLNGTKNWILIHPDNEENVSRCL